MKKRQNLSVKERRKRKKIGAERETVNGSEKKRKNEKEIENAREKRKKLEKRGKETRSLATRNGGHIRPLSRSKNWWAQTRSDKKKRELFETKKLHRLISC